MEEICDSIYDVVKDKDGTISKHDLMDHLERRGILEDDPRIAELKSALQSSPSSLDREAFNECISKSISTAEKAFGSNNVIADFENFSQGIKEIYDACEENKDGKMADYITQLSKQNPDHFAVSVCTVDGQRKQVGDTNVDFCLQSCVKPINYCLALEEHGVDKVHRHVGREPTSLVPNALKLNKDGLPHNPLAQSGAIMICSLIRNHLDADDRFEYVSKMWQLLIGGESLGYSNATYLSERNCGERNNALAYFMKEKKAFPPKINILDTLEFYYQCCSLTLTSDKLSIIAGTLANGGVCPLTGTPVFSPDTVKNCLSMMYSCGMDDYSGEFAFKIGLPAKSSLSGAIMLVIPNVMGICTFSPPLNQFGNSVKGIDFYNKLTQKFNFHLFDNIKMTSSTKEDPRKLKTDQEDHLESIIECSSLGDITSLRRMKIKHEDLFKANYDKRTALHLAASNGHLNIIKYLLGLDVDKNINAIDRWMGTPYDDAIRGGYHETAEYLQSKGGKSGIEIKMLNACL